VFPSVSRYLARVLCSLPVWPSGEGRAGERRIGGGGGEENPPPGPRGDHPPPLSEGTAPPLLPQVSRGPRRGVGWRGVGIRRWPGRGPGLLPSRCGGRGPCEARRGSRGRGGPVSPSLPPPSLRGVGGGGGEGPPGTGVRGSGGGCGERVFSAPREWRSAAERGFLPPR